MAEDTRSHPKKVLDAINAVIEKRATSDHDAYTVNGLSVTKMKIEELLKFKKFYEREVKREKDSARIADGYKPRNKIQVRFV